MIQRTTTPTARKACRCDSCFGMIDKGERYNYQTQVDCGRIQTYRAHTVCDIASSIVFKWNGGIECFELIPRVVDFEPEDIEAIRTHDPAIYDKIWG